MAYGGPITETSRLVLAWFLVTQGTMWRRSVFGAGKFHVCLRARGNGLLAQDSKPHKSFGTSAVVWTMKDEQVSPANNTDKKTDYKSKGKSTQATAKKNMLKILSEMKVDISSKKTFLKLKAQKMKVQTELPEHMESTSSMFQKAAEDKAKSKPLSPELVAAASAVASSLPLDKKKTVSELLQLLKKHKDITEARKRGENPDISNIITNMKIRRNSLPREAFRASGQIQFDEDGRGYFFEKGASRGHAGMKRRALFSGKRLNIFPVPPAPEGALETVTKPNIWDVELAKEIAAVGQRPPRNGFEEMIEWTKEGKLWEFPLDNEAGIEDDTEFYEHLFLEKHLADFPKEGPVRHFMELVTCGLSKNPYMSVKEKVEYIDWFRSYFKEKEELLKEIEAHEKEVLLEREKLAK
ncbi:small ribosomal subunit protein mS31 isoform X2 [Heteronotia binoei]|uniref:small ribosomal subunit protein mS31 isoform X2 n=1 Tax=Heteronotia binoei TaxID=13085 RepID=UPI00293045F6|nr:small ribosomal subunit protein mS31 isoform X2 [Heteronotia binoei]